jgi:hypothetical protein
MPALNTPSTVSAITQLFGLISCNAAAAPAPRRVPVSAAVTSTAAERYSPHASQLSQSTPAQAMARWTSGLSSSN